MSVSSVGSDSSDPNLLRSRIDAFRSGDVNISKADLDALSEKAKARGGKFADVLQKIEDNYDTVDVNGDGISYSELQTYSKTGALNLSPDAAGAGAGCQAHPHHHHHHGGMTKDELAALEDQSAQDGTDTPPGLDALVANFDAYDTNHDGKISGAEFEAFAKAQGITLPDGPPPALDVAASAVPDAASGAVQDGANSQTNGGDLTKLINLLLRNYQTSAATPDATQLLSGVQA